MKKINTVSSLSFLIVLYVSRNAIPYAVYPFITLLIAFTLLQFINLRETNQAIIKMGKQFFPIILLILIETVALFCTPSPYHSRTLDIFKDISIISSFLFLLAYNIQSKDNFLELIEMIGKFFILFSIIISLLGLWKFFYSPQLLSYKYVEGIRGFKWGSSLVADYNFFSLFLLNGLAFGLYTLLHSPEKIRHKILFLIALNLVIGVGFLSGSRRFIFCFCVFFVTCSLLSIPFLFKKIFSNKLSYKYLLLFLSLSIFNFGIIFSFLSYFPLFTEKVEKILFIDGHKTDLNIITVASRMNSVASFRLIKVRSIDKQTNNLVEKDIISITSSREDLWNLGKKIYGEYSITQKFFGNGFSFFNIFKTETKRFLYPHHLFLSVLLFSGILGLIVYIAILLWSVIIYLFHLKKLGILFFLFVLNFIFGFFSFTDFIGASFYSLLFILPFQYRALNNCDKNCTK